MSGASVYAYWTATYAWDLISYGAIVVATMIVFLVYHDRAFVGSFTKVFRRLYFCLSSLGSLPSLSRTAIPLLLTTMPMHRSAT